MNQITLDHSPYGEIIRVRGIVQGVGFRPMVFRLAQQSRLIGTVCNDGDGVLITVQGSYDSIEHFLKNLREQMPRLARIDSIEREVRQSFPAFETGFCITHSANTAANTGVTADAATCPECLEDILDPANRRYRYAFTNCTHCGPRLSIIRGIPYDRANTSMSVFPMCADCQREYDSPADRRFHAQPNACPVCGPQLWLTDANGEKIARADRALRMAALRIKEQAIVAIKGIGGFHLAADASNETAVQRLRQRKQRPRKAFALMATDVDSIRCYCRVSEQEQHLLESSAAPIVLLQKLHTAGLADCIAPGQKTLGFMLPYTALHHLLMRELDHPIVLTSGNAAHEPQCIDNEDAEKRLAGIADYFLLHDRTIENRIDDSVARIMDGKPQFYRRARGYAPEPLTLAKGFADAPDILALGGELKNTFCLIKNGQAILSQHMGDLENFATFEDYRHNLQLYAKLFQHQPQQLVIDAHPEYLSSKAGTEMAQQQAIARQRVSHHHAHIAACMADNRCRIDHEKVLGIALDGLGYGEGGTLWGGEFLHANYLDCERLAGFKPVALLGGPVAMQQPWRNTFAHLQSCLGWDQVQQQYPELELVHQLSTKPLPTFIAMLEQGMNCPTASSAGRLFDAVAAAVGICFEQIQYEGQAAIELEALISEQDWQQADTSAYPFSFGRESKQLNPTPMWQALLQDLADEIPAALISARFHKGLSLAIQQLADQLCQQNQISTIALSGGVFQNRALFTDVKQNLQKRGYNLLYHQRVPANDGGLALGQAAIAAARSLKR